MSAPAHADACLTPAEMRAITITLADLAVERMVDHCLAYDTSQMPFMSANTEAAKQHFDGLRPDATSVLVQKYAPFLASRPSIAQQTVEPILNLMIDSFALDEMDVEACSEIDIAIEAIAQLEPSQSADVLTVFMTRGAQSDENDTMLKPCSAATDK